MPTFPSFEGWTTVEKTEYFKLLKAEKMSRGGAGAVETGSSTGQSFSMKKWSDEKLELEMKGIQSALGYSEASGGGDRVRPNFSFRG